MSWDSAMTHELGRIYADAAWVPLLLGSPYATAHAEGLRAVASHAAEIERANRCGT